MKIYPGFFVCFALSGLAFARVALRHQALVMIGPSVVGGGLGVIFSYFTRGEQWSSLSEFQRACVLFGTGPLGVLLIIPRVGAWGVVLLLAWATTAFGARAIRRRV